jgi:hypothetical protein
MIQILGLLIIFWTFNSLASPPCADEMDKLLSTVRNERVEWEFPQGTLLKKDYENYIAQIVELEKKLDQAKDLDTRLSLSRTKFLLMDKYFSNGEKSFVEIFGFSFQAYNKPKFDVAYRYSIPGTSNLITYYLQGSKNLGFSYVLENNGTKIITDYFLTPSCRILSMKLDLDLGYSDNAHHFTVLRLHSDTCRSLKKIPELINLSYDGLLTFLQNTHTQAVFVEKQIPIIRHKIQSKCAEMIDLM